MNERKLKATLEEYWPAIRDKVGALAVDTTGERRAIEPDLIGLCLQDQVRATTIHRATDTT